MPSNSQPAVGTWNRLEPRPRKKDSDRPLRAEVRDALWMLTRQWQLGEFQAEDTGSAILAKVDLSATKVKYFQKGDASSAATISDEVALEVLAERESIPMDLHLRLEMGRHFLKILHKKLAGTVDPLVHDTKFITAESPAVLQLRVPEASEAEAALLSNRKLQQTLALAAAGKAFDGGALYAYLSATNTHQASDFLDARDGLVDAAGADFLAWFRRVYQQPTASEASAWKPSQLEYQLATSAPNADKSSNIMVADEYPGGRLEWYHFDHDTRDARFPAALHPGSPDTSEVHRESISLIPTEARFAGMPLSRWWEMEDGRVDFGAAAQQSSDTAQLLFSQFSVLFSNDWMILPHRVPVGSLSTVHDITITDTFGQRVQVRPAGEGVDDDWRRWNFFSLNQRDPAATDADVRLLVPAAIDRIQEGKPLEEVNFLRDEMANMVWAVENCIPDGLGGSMDGYEASLKLQAFLRELAGEAEPKALLSNDATVAYRMASSVPENWIPFVPVHVSGDLRSVQLQRAALPRYVDGLDPARIVPRTGLLQEAESPYYVHEEEVPRSGAVVKKRWQRTRWFDGKTYTWVGRRKRNGRGEGASGLAFDRVEAQE